MITIEREELLSSLTGAAAPEEKRRTFFARLEALLPEQAPSEAAEEAPDPRNIAWAIDQVLAGEWVTETLEVEDAIPMEEPFCTDQALSMAISRELFEDTAYIGEIFGCYCQDSGEYHALYANPDFSPNHELLGTASVGLIVPGDIYRRLRDSQATFVGYDWFGAYVDGHWLFHKTDRRHSTITVTQTFSFVTQAFSRNAGLLETDIMQHKTVVLAGVGSVGSFAAMMLAKAGVGNFILCDSDTLQIHNLSRHWLGMDALGQYKVDALARLIRLTDPLARVQTYRGQIQQAPEALFSQVTPGEGIVIATGDNRMCAAHANRLAQKLGLPFVAIGCWERAAVGEVFYWHKDLGMPTYEEAFRGMITEDQDEAHRGYFGSAQSARELRFEPGIFLDIAYVTCTGLKLCLDLMNRETAGYTPRVLEHLSNYTLVANTNDPALGGSRAALFPEPLFTTKKRHGICLAQEGAAQCLTISSLQEKT